MSPIRAAATTAFAASVAVTGLAVSSGTATAAGHTGVTGHTRVIADCVHRSVEPRRAISACGDAGVYAVITHYGYWNGHTAVGRGRLVANDCKPNCAAGTFHTFPATFRFHHVVDTRRGPLFTRLGVTYVKGGEQHDTQLFLPTRPL